MKIRESKGPKLLASLLLMLSLTALAVDCRGIHPAVLLSGAG